MSESWKVSVPEDFAIRTHDFHLFDFRFTARLSAGNASLATLPETERERAARFHQRIDRNRYVVGRNIVRQALAEVLGLSPIDVPLRVEKGRPFLDTVVARDCYFNLSHSGNCVMVILSPKYPVGIDVEVLREFPDMDQVANRVMTDQEFTEYMDLEPACRGDAFYRLWVRKESILKCMGTGFGIEPSRISVGHSSKPESEADFEGQRFTLQQTLYPDPGKPHFWAIAYTGANQSVTLKTYPIIGKFE